MITYTLGGKVVDKCPPMKAPPPPPPKPKLTRDSWPMNQAGFAILDPIRVYLHLNPNKSTKEIAAQFPDVNWKAIRYSVARGLKCGFLVVKKGKIPLYNVSTNASNSN